MGVEHEQDDVGARREPLQYLLVRVVSVLRLLAARQDTWRVDEGAPPREIRSDLAAGEAVEEALAELGELAKGRARYRDERVAGQLPLLTPVQDRLEAVSRWLGADVHAGKVLIEEVADE